MLIMVPAQAQKLVALSYHDVTKEKGADIFTVTAAQLKSHLDYLDRAGYQPVSLDDLSKAQRGELQLPDRAVLLTFDDGLQSYRDTVIPMLARRGYPSVLSVVTGWLDGKRVPKGYNGKMMDWASIKSLEKNPLVEIASHSHNLHHAIPSNPYGNTSYASTTRRYDAESGEYESEYDFESRIRNDLQESMRRLHTKLGISPAALTWPYGAYDQVTIGIARSLGFPFQITLDEGDINLAELPRIRRILVTAGTTAGDLAQWLQHGYSGRRAIRFVDFDLQPFIDSAQPSYETKLSNLLDRLNESRANNVIVAALSRDNSEATFYNHDLPVVTNMLDRILQQMRNRLRLFGVYVRIPANLHVANPERFYRDLARLNNFSGLLFEEPGEPQQLAAIKRTVRRYRPKAEFGYYGTPKHPDFYDFIVLKKTDATAISDIRRSVGRYRTDSRRVYVSLVTDGPRDPSRVAHTMFKLREAGIENYGYRDPEIIDTQRMRPEVVTEMAVTTPPKRPLWVEVLFFFVFFYPLFMAIVWMMGAVTFYLRRERNERRAPQLEAYPHVSILVPCHNEQTCISDTITHLSKNNYPNFDIIAIDDGSIDGTLDILQDLAQSIDCLRVVTLTRNYGKAEALRAGAIASRGEFLMCTDADALLDKDALFWMIRHFLTGSRVGAVTGNPRVLNRTSLLARIQIGEFSAIVGMIKRAQRSIGRLFTVSGVHACYRRAAVHNVGYWTTDTATEDVDMSWKLQLAHWDIRYEPRALSWILAPESLKGLWKQRLRWAKGGFESATRYAGKMRNWRSRRMWSVFFEYWVGTLWCYALLGTFIFWAATNLLPEDVWPASLRVRTLLPGWTGVVLAVVCLVQFVVGLSLDGQYEHRGLMRYLFWAIWYPAIYWVLNALTTVVAIPIGIAQLLRKHRSGLWESPGRNSKLTSVHRRQTSEERRTYYQHREASKPRIATVAIVTVVFWGAWMYFIAPLISIFLWFGGIYLFTDRMIAMGGYHVFTEQLVNYATAIFAMAATLSAWVTWNKQRYGRREKRCSIQRHVSDDQMSEFSGLDKKTINDLRKATSIVMHYHDGHPVIEKKAP
jgi:biofilm PGA synthesis N-glycosyltransferase PgaC